MIQIKAAVTALRNIRALPWPGNNQKPDPDLLDWLQAMFGFQVFMVGGSEIGFWSI